MGFGDDVEWGQCLGLHKLLVINLWSLLKSVGKHRSNCPNRRERTWARATLSGAASSGGRKRTVYLIDLLVMTMYLCLFWNTFFCIESTVIEKLDKTSCQVENHSWLSTSVVVAEEVNEMLLTILALFLFCNNNSTAYGKSRLFLSHL